ncbi:unnamed protein product [Vicia faba]|uniref:DUF1985 domain-containing protein n=1 Tax=Vicia faba TaxID=3906 RepID=A0AAV1B307_VICFA|nr:unnamed protein product [Vicia faba]
MAMSTKDTEEIRQSVKLGAGLATLCKLKLSPEKKNLMVNSVFYDVINIQNNKESSSIFIKLFGDFYDPTNRRFVLNNNTSFSFCAKEVADVLGIENTGPDFNAPAAKKVPQFVKDLVIGYGVDSSGKISTTTIKELLKKMNVDDEESRLNFKKVLCYFLIEMFLIPSPDPKKPRTGSWSMVEDLDVYEKVNWAKAIYEDLHESFNKLKTATVGKQHNFKACAPVFEAVVFERIPSLKPNLSSYPYPPIQKYDAKRKDWELLKSIKADEITPCSYCGDGVEGLFGFRGGRSGGKNPVKRLRGRSSTSSGERRLKCSENFEELVIGMEERENISKQLTRLFDTDQLSARQVNDTINNFFPETGQMMVRARMWSKMSEAKQVAFIKDFSPSTN